MNAATVSLRQPAEARQAEMVQAVLCLAAQQEPASITTTDIAKAVGLSQGAVFRHFPNKQAIWLNVAQWLEATLLPLVQTAAQSSPRPADQSGQYFPRSPAICAGKPRRAALHFPRVATTR